MLASTCQEGRGCISNLFVLTLALATGVLWCPLASGIGELKAGGRGTENAEVEGSATMSYLGCG